MNTTQKASGIIAVAVVAASVILYNYTVTSHVEKVPCLIPKFDTTQEQVKDSINVHYISGYDTVYKRKYLFRPRQIKRIDTLYADSFHYTFSSRQVIIDNSYMGLCDSIVNDTTYTEPPPTKAQYGVLVNDKILKTKEKVQVWQLYGIPLARTEVTLFDFNGTADNIQQYHDAGAKIILNVNWENNNPSKARKFISDTGLLAQKLDAVFEKYGSMILIAVVENEILTQNYFSDDMQNYITELRVAIREGEKYGIIVTNSGDHLEYINAILSGSKTMTIPTQNCKYLMEHYKDMGLTVINTHTGKLFSDVTTTETQMKAIANYIRTTTGVNDLISNETVMQQTTSTYVNNVIHLYNIASFSKVIIFDGEGSGDLGAQSLHVNGKVQLAPLGQTFISSVNTVALQ